MSVAGSASSSVLSDRLDARRTLLPVEHRELTEDRARTERGQRDHPAVRMLADDATAAAADDVAGVARVALVEDPRVAGDSCEGSPPGRRGRAPPATAPRTVAPARAARRFPLSLRSPLRIRLSRLRRKMLRTRRLSDVTLVESTRSCGKCLAIFGATEALRAARTKEIASAGAAAGPDAVAEACRMPSRPCPMTRDWSSPSPAGSATSIATSPRWPMPPEARPLPG